MASSCRFGGGICPFFAIEGGSGYCSDHAPKRAASRAELQKHYGAPHKRLRLMAFVRDRWACVKCDWAPRCVREWKRFPETRFPPADVILAELTVAYKRSQIHLEADHIIDVDTRPDLAAVLSNMQTLCSGCHAIKNAAARGRRS